MKRAVKEPPTDEQILRHSNVPILLASEYIGWSTTTLYRALQDERAPFGFAVRNDKTDSWTYHISPGLLVKYKRGELPTYRLNEVIKLFVEGAQELLDAKMSGLSRLLESVGSL